MIDMKEEKMANPDIPVREDDIRFEDRDGCFVLVDPAREGSRDIGIMWPADGRRYVVRFGLVAPTPEPLPVLDRDAGMQLLLDAYRVYDHGVIARLEEQRPRFSFGFPQIFRAGRRRA
jgi:hypothetical protein